jgi:putative spermidine/putrescine transport system ATP-binding protein
MMSEGRPTNITLDDVAKTWRGKPERGAVSRGSVAVDGVSLDIRAGEFLTLLGPSGSGKTTLLNILAGFLAPDRGYVRFDGVDVTGFPPERRGLGMVFQSYSLFPHMSVAANVAFPLRMRGVPRAEWPARVAAALDLVRLDGYAERRPAQLSGGQQQRVAFARAIVARPGVLLMDEPLAALDLKLREAMQAEIAEYRRAIGATFVYVTHDQGEAMALSDRIAVLDRGRIAQCDTPEMIYDRPASRFVAGFIGQANFLPATYVDGAVRLADLDALLTVSGPAPAGPAALCIRPEHMRRGGDGPALQVQITEATFQGDAHRYAGVTASGVRLGFSEPRGADVLQPGSRVALAFDPARAVLVPDEASMTEKTGGR